MARVKRRRLSRRYNKRIFRRTARKVHKRNLPRHTSRGGIRL
ncbi:hypothetical protein [Microvirus mar15]|uniref:Nonstructural protein n=1 Tax=Microvirus mar15 TaxID=2851147 RepID=A0A8F5XRA3_9VIRU|nr:hypothetical protein [Microvirus mar15]